MNISKFWKDFPFSESALVLPHHFNVEKQAVIFKVSLGRRLLGTILTVFLPTVLLNLLGHSANYFKDFFFEAAVTVNLTVMLVLTTMFINVSNQLPNTSYIKMIDVWLIFNLIVPFVEVLLHTYKVRYGSSYYLSS